MTVVMFSTDGCFTRNWKETAKINIHPGWIISVEIVIAPEGGNPLLEENTDDCDYALICADALLRQNST